METQFYVLSLLVQAMIESIWDQEIQKNTLWVEIEGGDQGIDEIGIYIECKGCGPNCLGLIVTSSGQFF